MVGRLFVCTTQNDDDDDDDDDAVFLTQCGDWGLAPRPRIRLVNKTAGHDGRPQSYVARASCRVFRRVIRSNPSGRGELLCDFTYLLVFVALALCSDSVFKGRMALETKQRSFFQARQAYKKNNVDGFVVIPDCFGQRSSIYGDTASTR